MKVVYTHNRDIKNEQKLFILSSIKNSFPKAKIIIKKKNILLLNKDSFSEIKKSCIKLIKLSDLSTKKSNFLSISKKKICKKSTSIFKKKKRNN